MCRNWMGGFGEGAWKGGSLFPLLFVDFVLVMRTRKWRFVFCCEMWFESSLVVSSVSLIYRLHLHVTG